MAYTENKSIDWLTAITPTTDDLVVTMDQTEVWVAKSSTLASIYNLFKTTYDTLYAKYLGDADFYKYSIVRSVWNLIANNSFEVDLSWYATYWLLTISRVTSEFYNWVASMQIVASNNTSWVYVWYSFVVGKTYTMSFYAKWTSWKQILSYTDAGWTLTSTLNWWWQRFEYTFIASSSGLVWINFRSQEALWDTFYIDAVQLEEWTLTAWPFTTTQWNLTVALKNYEGNDPTASKPVKIQIGGVIRTITSGTSLSPSWDGSSQIKSWTNWFNLWSAELATKETDLFLYLVYDTTLWNIGTLVSRIPYWNTIADFSATWTNEKARVTSPNINPISTDPVVNIGRFNATLSAGGAYTWSIPATSVIINSPIYETRPLDFIPTLYGSGGTAGTFTATYEWKYTIRGKQVFFSIKTKCTNVGSWSGSVLTKLPFFSVWLTEQACSWWFCANWANPSASSKALPVIFSDEINWLAGVDTAGITWWTFVVNDHIRVQWFYNI